MFFKIENQTDKEKLKNYFEYDRKKRISIIRIAYLVVFFLVVFNIAMGIKDIRRMQDYILSNRSFVVSSKLEEKDNEMKKINIGNIKKIFKTLGIENINSLYIDKNNIQIIGESNDMKTIKELMKNKILRNSYIKKLEGGENYTFEINSRTDK